MHRAAGGRNEKIGYSNRSKCLLVGTHNTGITTERGFSGYDTIES